MSNENIQKPLKKMANKISALYSSLIRTERRDLLWENPNPTSAFDGQTISIDLSAYGRVDIEFFPYAYTGQYDIVSHETIPVGKKGYLHANMGSSGTTSGSFYAFRRDIEATSSGVVFSAVYGSVSGGAWSVYSNKTGCVPYRIYGMRTVIGANENGMADYVEYQGTSGQWTYRKWNSGICELWGVGSTTQAINTAIGSAKRIANEATETYPFNITDARIQLTPATGRLNYAYVSEIANNYFKWYAVKEAADTSSVAREISIYVIGRWK